MNVLAAATAVGLCLLCPWLSGECYAKTLRLAVRSGSALCAVSPENETTSINYLMATDKVFPHLPPQVRCARDCTSKAPCHSFNYRSDANSCQFYHYPPTVCQVIPNCEYFEVQNFIRAFIFF